MPFYMNTIANLLNIDAISVDVDVASRKRAFEEAALLIEKTAGVDHRKVFDALIARERIGTTCLCPWAAIPHGRIDGLDKLALAVIRTVEPVDFDTPDNRMAKLIFAVAIPQDDSETYLTVLGELAGMLRDKAMKEKLLHCADASEMCSLISSWAPEPEAMDPNEEQ